jgi:hypothetical protein
MICSPYVKIVENPPIGTLVRLYDVDELNYPHMTPEQWVSLCRRDSHAVQQVAEKGNKTMDEGLKIIAASIMGNLLAWQNTQWYRQAVGTSTLTPTGAEKGLIFELYRKKFTSQLQTLKTITTNTFFSGFDFSNPTTTVAASPAPTTTVFTINASTGFSTDDMVRVYLPTGYEFKTVTLAGLVATMDTPLSAAPAAGATMDQVTEECGLFGDLPAQYVTGTVTVNVGSAVVTGVGTLWLNQLGPGDQILVGGPASGSRIWYTILTVDSNTQVTLTSNYLGPSSAGNAYCFRGTIYNRVNLLRYVKSPTRGTVVENSWLIGG